jgi:general secretion pathway protein G
MTNNVGKLAPFKRCKKQRGFTLIEMLITVAIVAILASVALPLSAVVSQHRKEQELRTALLEVRIAIDTYKQAADEKRIAQAADQSGYPRSLQVLVDGVVDAKSPQKTKIYFLRRIPRDPMQRETKTPAANSWGLRSYASGADDPQEGADVYDVYSLSAKTGINGVPYREW